VVVLVEKVYLYLSEGAMVQKLTFQEIDGGHLGYFGLNGLLVSDWCHNQSPSGWLSGKKCTYTWF